MTRDLHALVEAAATRRFWHSPRPSCCPRCDKEIVEEQWRREQDGHCSLCDGELIEVGEPTPADRGAASEREDDQDDDLTDSDEAEDELAGVQAQLAELRRLQEEVGQRDIEAKAALRTARATAAASALALDKYDRASATQRRQIEDRISVLRGRIEEREAINAALEDPQLEEQTFAREVFKAAGEYAEKNGTGNTARPSNRSLASLPTSARSSVFGT